MAKVMMDGVETSKLILKDGNGNTTEKNLTVSGALRFASGSFEVTASSLTGANIPPIVHNIGTDRYIFYIWLEDGTAIPAQLKMYKMIGISDALQTETYDISGYHETLTEWDSAGETQGVARATQAGSLNAPTASGTDSYRDCYYNSMITADAEKISFIGAVSVYRGTWHWFVAEVPA